MAERYDELRASEEQLARNSSSRSAEGLGAATRLLDVGCGTGALVAAAVERLGVKAWGVDASEAMLAKARERRVRGAAFKLAQADDLPFRKAWFDAVTMRLVVHTLGERRPRALAEARRVLAPEGRLFIWTFAPDHFTGHHLRTYLPDLPAVDLARFPSAEVLTSELAERASATCACAGSSRAARSPVRAPRSNSAPGTSRPSTCCHPSRWPPRRSDWRPRPQPPTRRSRPCCAGSSSSRAPQP